MSEVVTSFEGRQGRPPLYPWGSWMDGEIHKLFKNVDFNGQPTSFRVGAHRTAKNYGLKVHTEIVDDGNAILIEFYEPDSEEG
jgi:hypothetical protein